MAVTWPLRHRLMQFYAHATEHTRRLVSIEANAKFGAPAAGPDSGDLYVRCGHAVVTLWSCCGAAAARMARC
jgi:hypothetical protein